MPIDRRQIFTLAWKSARGTAAGYPSLRAAFAAALRRVWSLVKAALAEETRRPFVPQRTTISSWATENPYRARAVAARQKRLGTYSVGCW